MRERGHSIDLVEQSDVVVAVEECWGTTEKVGVEGILNT